MSAHIPPESARTPLTENQKNEIGTILKQDGVKFDPKDLDNMAALKKLLHSQGRDDEFMKVMKVVKGFSSEGMTQSTPKSSIDAATGKKINMAFEKAFGKEHATQHMQDFKKYLEQERPAGTPAPTGAALATQMEQYLSKQHVPQVEAKALSTEAIQGDSEGGMGTISSGGAETE